jgi:hypothetical protein
MDNIVCVEGVHSEARVLSIEMASLSHEETTFAELTRDQVLVSCLFKEKRLDDSVSSVRNI